MKYHTIVADPPWDVKAGPGWNPNGKSRPLEYPTMTLDQIIEMRVYECAMPDAHLYLWTINKYIEQSYSIARAWGFEPSTMLVWAKQPHGIGLGGTYILTTEYLLFGRRGSLPSKMRIDTSWFLRDREEHSKKPEFFQNTIEAVSPGPYLELFARRKRTGMTDLGLRCGEKWTVWGNEVECDDPEVVDLLTPKKG